MNEVQLHMKHSVFGNRNDVEYVTEGSAGIENTGIHPFIYNFCKLYHFIISQLNYIFHFLYKKNFMYLPVTFLFFAFLKSHQLSTVAGSSSKTSLLTDCDRPVIFPDGFLDRGLLSPDACLDLEPSVDELEWRRLSCFSIASGWRQTITGHIEWCTR